ncbi:cupin-like domain-containing protein [Sorangium sp. So ce136]|uniref:cupin-like domain-containing protein n=1 Tax=Sorangium sp. So ce136 TaxID=3133284 RepID=UPI003F021087
MQPELHTNLHDIVRTLLPSVADGKPQTVVQFTVRDKRLTAYVVVDRTAHGETLRVEDGKHGRPDASIFLSTADLADIASLGCVRGPVSMTGSPPLLSSFRDRFMSISPAGKARIEEITRSQISAEVDRISIAATSPADFIQRYAMASRPAVIVDAMPKRNASPWTIERIRSELGDASVEVRTGNYAADIYKETMQTKELRLAEYLASHGDGLADSVQATPRPYAASNGVPWDWHLWLDYPPFVPEGLCQYAKFWIGPAGTTTPLHRDWLDNFLSQLVGTKRIALVSPHHAPLLSPRVIHAGLDSCNTVDPFEPQHQVTSKCDPVFVTLNAGEMLFLPAGWFHDVRSTSFSFSVNFFLMRIPYAVCPPDWTTLL